MFSRHVRGRRQNANRRAEQTILEQKLGTAPESEASKLCMERGDDESSAERARQQAYEAEQQEAEHAILQMARARAKAEEAQRVNAEMRRRLSQRASAVSTKTPAQHSSKMHSRRGIMDHGEARRINEFVKAKTEIRRTQDEEMEFVAAYGLGNRARIFTVQVRDKHSATRVLKRGHGTNSLEGNSRSRDMKPAAALEIATGSHETRGAQVLWDVIRTRAADIREFKAANQAPLSMAGDGPLRIARLLDTPFDA